MSVAPGTGLRPAVFLDRDGTLITELGYLADPDALELVPGAGEALALLGGAGFARVLVTNQSGIARGLIEPPALDAVHARLRESLARAGGALDLVLVCPHHPELGAAPWRRACTCRKPEPGLILEAARRLGLDLARSWVVGDDRRDLEAGRRAGVPGRVLVLTGKGVQTRAALSAEEEGAVLVAADVGEAARWIVARAARGGPQGR